MSNTETSAPARAGEAEGRAAEMHPGHRQRPLADLADLLGLGPDAVGPLDEATTHRSYSYEHGCRDLEVLEFLGDSILGAAVAAEMLTHQPDLSPGVASRQKSSIVSVRPLAAAARRIGLGDYLQLSRGEAVSGGRDKANVLSDAFEAVIAAVFLQHGFDRARVVARRLLEPEIVGAATECGPYFDWKTHLQSECARLGVAPPAYDEATGTGPDHAREYSTRVRVPALGIAADGIGRSKKAAEHAAAEAASAMLPTDASSKSA